MKVFEYEGFTKDEAESMGQDFRLQDLEPAESVPPALIDLAPGVASVSANDREELKRFAGWLNQLSKAARELNTPPPSNRTCPPRLG